MDSSVECENGLDLIVIGAGVMGSSTAYQAAKRGHKVVLLEQFDFLHHRGSSHGESRTIRATYPEHYYSDMVIKSAKLWREAETEVGYRVYTKTRQLDIGPAGDSSLQAVISSCQKTSLPFSLLNSHQVGVEFSGKLSIPEDWVAVYTEEAGVIKPTKAVSMFQTLALQNGAFLRDNIQVVDIQRDQAGGEVVVYTKSGEEFRGKKCVVTAGAWTKKLFEKACGVDYPIQSLETSVSYWRIKEGYDGIYGVGDGFPTFASYGDVYIYGTPSLEFPGLIKIGVHGGRPCDPDSRSWKLGFRLNALRQWIEDRFQGGVDASAPVSTQSCIYSMTPDEDFVIDFVGGDFGNDVVVGGGFSGHGFKMAPIVGKMLADLALTGKSEEEGVEMKHFRIARFQGNPKGNAKEYADQVGSSVESD